MLSLSIVASSVRKKLTSNGLFFLRFFLKLLCALTVMIKLLFVMMAGIEKRIFLLDGRTELIRLLLETENAPVFLGRCAKKSANLSA